MTTLPIISSTRAVGIYQVCTTANTDYVLTVPEGARGLVIWFETSASSGVLVGGRIGVDGADTAVTGINGTDDNLGYHPAMPVEYEFRRTYNQLDAFVHIACPTALAVARGMWLYRTD